MKTSRLAAFTTALAICAGGSAALAGAADTTAAAGAGQVQSARDRIAGSALSCGADHPWPIGMQAAVTPATEVLEAAPLGAPAVQPDGLGHATERRSEPGTLALIVAGLALMGFVAGRRQARDPA